MAILRNRSHLPTTHLSLTRSESRIWNQYQLTPSAAETAAALGLKKSTIETALLVIKQKLSAGANPS